MAVAVAFQDRDTLVLDMAVAVSPAGAAGGVVGTLALTEKFQFPPPLLSQVFAPLLKTIPIVVAVAGTM